MAQPIEITLTDAEIALIHDSIDAAVGVGDCELVNGSTLRFTDYEGSVVFLARMYFRMAVEQPPGLALLRAIVGKVNANLLARVDSRKVQQSEAY